MAEGEFFPIPEAHFKDVIVIDVFAILSAMALLSVAFRVLWLAIRKLWRSSEIESQEYAFFKTQLGNYAACLLVGNLLSSIAGLMGLSWLVQKGITDGGTCRAQAFVMQAGNWASAYFTVAIAVHTLNSLVLKKRQSNLISIPTMVIGWAIAAIAASIPFVLHDPEGQIYGPEAGLSCGIRATFPKLQFIFHLLPIFIASLLSAFLYSLIYLVLRGTLKIKGGIKLTLDPNRRWDGDMESYHRFIARVARSMLWYPVTYITLLVPYSVMRLLVISGFTIAWEALVFAFVCWFLLGALDVLLLYNTFRVLGPAFDGVSSANTSRRTMESFGPTGYFLKTSRAYDEEKGSALQARVDQYRFPLPFNKAAPTEHHSRSSSQTSSRTMPQTQHERNTSANSILSLGRPITPVDQLQRMVAVPPPAPVAGTPKSLPKLDTSLKSLPAPPRRNASPSPLSIYSVSSGPDTAPRSPIVTPEGVWTIVTPRAPPQSVVLPPSATFGQQWAASGKKIPNKPSLSAVNTAGPRPLLLGTSPNTSPYSLDQPLPTYSPSLSRNNSDVASPPRSYRPPAAPAPRAF